jgi:threonine dehydrogenase-like Zn-dependent dehydrogenase
MKALIVEQPGRLAVHEIRRPAPGDYEALVRVLACGICNSTDLHLIDGDQPYHNQYPAVLGHEAVGEIVAVGSKVRSLRLGMRVTRPCAIWPGDTQHGVGSAWGGFADFGIVRDRLALAADGQTAAAEDFMARRQIPVPDDISPADASLTISLAEISSWIEKLQPLGGKRVVILGTGIAGYAMAFFSKLAGALQVIVLGRREERLQRAMQVGATHAFLSDAENIQQVREIAGGGADWLFEAAGDAQGFARWLSCLRAGGGAAIYGVAPQYTYSLPLLNAPPELVLRVPSPDDARTYHWVCGLISAGTLDPKLFTTHAWKWPGDALPAIDSVRRRKVVKGFLVFE